MQLSGAREDSAPGFSGRTGQFVHRRERIASRCGTATPAATVPCAGFGQQHAKIAATISA